MTQSSELTAALIDWNTLPFQTHKDIQNIWGLPDHAEKLATLIEADGGITDELLCARVKGMNGKPILYDGYTRLIIWFSLRARLFSNEACPKFRIVNFQNFGDVLRKVLKIQSSRRNLTAPQVAYAALEGKRLQGYDIAPKEQGRPTKSDKRTDSLLPLPSAKKLAEEFGVSDPIIRAVQQAIGHDDSSIITRMLLKPENEDYISPKQVTHRFVSHRRERQRQERANTLEKRRSKIARMKVGACPDTIEAEGIYTIDAVEGMKRIAPGTVDLICTSIPYYCGLNYDRCQSNPKVT